MTHSVRNDDVTHHLHCVMQMYCNDFANNRVQQAFLSLIRHSDAVGWATPPLNESSLEQLTDVVMKLLYWDTGEELQIPLDVGRALCCNNIAIDYYDVFSFLEMHSEDIFGQAMSHGRNTQSISEIDQMLVGIALRYRFCAMHEQRYFPVSAVLELRDAVRRLSSKPDCGDTLVCQVLETLRMLERDSTV